MTTGLILELPERSTVLARNRQRWTEVLSDPNLALHPNRIETNRFGQVVMTPPPSVSHGTRQSRIAVLLQGLLGDQVVTECPLITCDGVKAVDVAWYSPNRFVEVRKQVAAETAPEICVEVLSPSNTDDEMRMKRELYFDAGAKECWICDESGRMSYYSGASRREPSEQSTLCPEFPNQIED
jgi:Uma2 family endonuclease